MPFQFVNTTPNDPDYSAETRRQIRSQAMRDFRRRQRDDNEVESSSEPSPPSSLASPALSSGGVSRADSRQRQSRSQSLSVESSLLRRHSSGTSSDNLPVSHRVTATHSKRPSPQSPTEDERMHSSQGKRRHNDRPRAQHGVFSQFMVSLPTRPTHAAPGDSADGMTSLEQLDTMLAACEGYNAWLTGTRARADNSISDDALCDEATSRMLLSALCLQSVGSLQAVQTGQACVDKNLLKTDVLALLNKRLKNADKALEDHTIGALACLASYEMSQGSSEATMHLSGLQQILKLRGGTHAIGDTAGLPMMLEILDLCHAVYFHTEPMYTSRTSDAPDRLSHGQSTSPPAAPVAEPDGLNERMLDDINNFILSIPEVDRDGESIPEELGLDMPTAPQSSLEENAHAWHHALYEPVADPAAYVDLRRICRLAADVHRMSMMSANETHRICAQAANEALFGAISAVEDSVWLEVSEELRARVLLTALSATADPKAKTWLYAHLTRQLYQTGSAEEWNSVKALLLGFVEMQRGLRGQPAARTVKVGGALDVEIVV